MGNLKDNIKLARTIKNINQVQLAKLLNISQASISQFEKGERFPSESTLKKIAKVLDTTPQILTGDDESVIGQDHLLKKIKGLSPNSINILSDHADYLIFKENNK